MTPKALSFPQTKLVNSLVQASDFGGHRDDTVRRVEKDDIGVENTTSVALGSFFGKLRREATGSGGLLPNSNPG